MEPRVASSEEKRAFWRDGVVPVRGLVGATWLDRLADAIERDIRTPGPYYHGYEAEGEGRFHGNLRLWQSDPTFAEFCTESVLPELARQFLESAKINLLYDQLFVKESMTHERTRWHNDQPYWPIAGRQVLSIWVALDPVTLASGALEFVRGSHDWDRWFQPETFGKTRSLGYERNPDYEPMPDIEANRADYDIVSWDLQPGDAYVFHAMTVHGAGGNQQRSVRRRGYTVRYVGDDVVYDPRIGTTQTLLNPDLASGDPLDSEQYPRLIG